MSDRIQGDLKRTFKNVLKIRDQYNILIKSNPPPWSNNVKIKIESKLQILRTAHETLLRFVEKWEDHAKRIKDANQKNEEYEKFDAWRDDEDNIDTIQEITEILLQGERYLSLQNGNTSNHSTKSDSTQHSTPANNMPTTTKIPALNIQKFNGDYLKWKSFWQRFELNVHNHPFSKVEKLDALVGLLEGEALDEIAGFEIVEENYDTVVKTLQDRFGNSKIILMELYNNLRAVPPSTSEAKSLRKTVNAITNMCRQLQNYGVDINNASLQTEIIQKMPPREKNELTWFQISNENVSTEMILKEMKQIALKAEISTQDIDESFTAEQHQHTYTKTTSTYAPQYEEYNTHQKAESSSNKKFVCTLCEGDHLSAHCQQFPTVEEKIKQLKLKNCCTKCARRNHDAKQCHSDIRCKNCNGDHYAFICPSRSNGNFRQSKTTNAMVSIGVQQGCLLTKQVTVINPDTQKTADATVFFDSGSQKSYICDQLIRQLKLPRVAKENLHIQGIGAQATNYTSSLVKLKIKTTESYEEISANSIRKIADSVPLMSCNGKFDPASFRVTNHQPDILIGMDYFFNFITSFEKRNGYVIVHSKVGQMLSSNIPELPKCTISTLAINSSKHQKSNTSKQKAKSINVMSAPLSTEPFFPIAKTSSVKQYNAKTQNTKAATKFKTNSSGVQLNHAAIEKQSEKGHCHGQSSSLKKKQPKNGEPHPLLKHTTLISNTVIHQSDESKTSKLGGGEGLMEELRENGNGILGRLNSKSVKVKEAGAKPNNVNSSVGLKINNKLLKGWVTKNYCSSEELCHEFASQSEISIAHDSKD